MDQHRSDDTLSREDLLDRVEGLEADLDDAVSVAVARGALDWARLNYPDHPSLKKGGAAMTSHVASARLALGHARTHHEGLIAKMRKYLENGGLLFAHLEEPPTREEVETLIGKHDFAAQAIDDVLRDFEPETSKTLTASLRDMAVEVAKAERARCESAVSCAWAPITGTPYTAGPRAFSEAIRKLPRVEDTLVDFEKGCF